MSVSIRRTSLDRNTRGDRGMIISICGYVPIDSSVSTADITINYTVAPQQCTGDIKNRSTKTVHIILVACYTNVMIIMYKTHSDLNRYGYILENIIKIPQRSIYFFKR